MNWSDSRPDVTVILSAISKVSVTCVGSFKLLNEANLASGIVNVSIENKSERSSFPKVKFGRIVAMIADV